MRFSDFMPFSCGFSVLGPPIIGPLYSPLCKIIQKVMYIIVAEVVVYIFRNFNQYIFTNNEKTSVTKVS